MESEGILGNISWPFVWSESLEYLTAIYLQRITLHLYLDRNQDTST